MKQNRMFSDLLNPLYEGCDLASLCVATYLVGAHKDEGIVIKAQSIGIEQTTGSWVDVPAETNTTPTVETPSKSESPVSENTNELELKMSPSEDKSQEEPVGTMNSFGVISMEWSNH